MSNMTEQQLRTLDGLVDLYGVREVLRSVALICEEKARRPDWDEPAREKWRQTAATIESAAANVEDVP